MFIVCFIIGILFLILAYVIGVKKQYMLISGINTSTPEQRAKMDLDSICRVMGKFFAVIGVGSIMCGLAQLLFGKYAVFVSVTTVILFCLILFGVIILVIYIQRFDKGNFTAEGKINKRFAVIISVIIVISVIVVGLLCLLFYNTIKQPDLIFEGTEFKITGFYNSEIKAGDITNITEIDVPEVKFKANGAALSGYYKGYFEVSDYGRVKISASKKSDSWIYIETSGQNYMYSCNSSEETDKKLAELLNWYANNQK